MSLRRFDGSNFNFWKEQMQDYLIVKGQIDPFENESAPEIYKANEWQKLDKINRCREGFASRYKNKLQYCIK